MVYTITFNPALDYIVNVSDFKEGVVNRTCKEKILPGGKGINVSIVLNNLGVENTAMGFTAGFTGNIIEKMLLEQGVKCDFTALTEGNSRINVKIKSQKETEINAQGPAISEEKINELYEKLESMKQDDILVLAGSVPNALPDSIYCDIMQRFENNRIIVDATGKLLINVLKFRPFLIKPNIFELEETFETDIKTEDEIIDYAKKLMDMGAKNVLVSLGGDGAILVTENGEVLKRNAPKGTVVNTTGAGDSMIAGFIAGYLEKNDFSYALKMGISAGSASSFSENLATGDEIVNVYNSID